MRLGTLQSLGGPIVVGVHTETGKDQFVELRTADPGLPPTLAEILALSNGLERARAALSQGVSASRFVTGTLLAPIPRPPKVLCIGLNYRDHARETNASIPAEPIVFSKFATAVIGPGSPIVLPRVSQKVDYEAELVVVIGRRGKHISQAEAGAYIAGYTNGNDVSARDWQLEKPGKQWLLGKTPDTFVPTGPYMVTAEEVGESR